jgi:hypothetical protein
MKHSYFGVNFHNISIIDGNLHNSEETNFENSEASNSSDESNGSDKSGNNSDSAEDSDGCRWYNTFRYRLLQQC